MSKEAMKQALEALKNNRRKHYGCEDTWYSCPKHEDGCFDEHAGSECNCGADEANVEIDAAIKVLQEQQEPVAKSLLVNLYNTGYKDGHHDTVEGQYTDVHQSDMDTYHLDVVANWLEENPPAQAQQCRTDGRCQYAIDVGTEGWGRCPKGKCVMSAQHTWVGLSDEELFGLTDEMYSFARHIESKLKEKNI